MNTDGLLDWILHAAPGIDSPESFFDEIAGRTRAAGIEVDRIWMAMESQHPGSLGLAALWRSDAPIAITSIPYGPRPRPDYPDSPVARLFAGEDHIRVRLDRDPLDPRSAELKAEGYTDYYLLRGPEPLPFEHERLKRVDMRLGSMSAFATRRPGGWTDVEFRALKIVARACLLVTRLAGLRMTTRHLLQAYLGQDAGSRVLLGHVQRGDVRTIEAALLFTDLRDFTHTSEVLAPEELMAFLDDAFDAQIGAIEAHGGQVLQIVGDALLAIFESEGAPADACHRALEAVRAMEQALDDVNARREADGQLTIGWGAGLHYGDAHHGNFGSATRLAFTVNGPAVNRAARLESLGARMGIRPALSARFVAESGVPATSHGHHEAKGLADPLEIFALAPVHPDP